MQIYKKYSTLALFVQKKSFHPSKNGSKIRLLKFLTIVKSTWVGDAFLKPRTRVAQRSFKGRLWGYFGNEPTTNLQRRISEG